MNWISILVFKLGKGMLVKKLKEESFKEFLVYTINKKVDIPKLNEQQEAELFGAVYDAVEGYLIK